jgi:hypothetical protein
MRRSKFIYLFYYHMSVYKEYFENYNKYTKNLIFNFDYGMGGIGDYFKFFMYALKYCIDHNIRLYLYIKHDINKYIKLKYDKMYININNIKYKNINKYKDLEDIDDKDIYLINPFIFYDVQQEVYDNATKCILDDIFYFTEDILNNTIQEKYISIHLRLGDKFLETDKNYIVCKEDVRVYNEKKLNKFLEDNKDKNIYFFCDNYAFKKNIKDNYENVHIIDVKVGHTSLLNVTEDEIKNSIIEFYILSKSEKIYWASWSGFSFMASRFYNTKFIGFP